MKLYPRLALTILILIIMQASFTGFYVSRRIRNNNLEDARIELKLKTDFIINNYHSWKRHFWKQLILIQKYTSENTVSEMAEDELNDLLTSTGIDAVIVKGKSINFSIEAINSSPDFILPRADDLNNIFDHPSIRLFNVRGQFYMVGIISLQELDTPVEIYLIKHINDSFLKNIVFDTDGKIIFHTLTDFLAGFSELQKIAFRHIQQDTAYLEQYAIQDQGESFNMAGIKIGEIISSSGSSDVFLSIILSNDPYQRRIKAIERTVLTVSLFTLIFTALLSLLFTRGITKPVASLVNAMGRIREGRYDIQIKNYGRSEMGILLQGFNGMAARLHHDQIQIEKSLDEITFLNEFNEEVIHSIRDALAVVNDDLVIEKSNPAFDQLTGGKCSTLSEFVKQAFDDSLIEIVQNVLNRDSKEWTRRIRNRNKGIFELKIYPVHREFHIHSDKKMCVLILEDVSARTAYEEKINQAEKLSSISMLSAGIAHEVNNPLSSIITNIQNLIYEETDPIRLESLQLIEDESQRIAQIIRDLTDFTSREKDLGTRCSALQISEEVKRLIQHSRRIDGSRIPPIKITDEGVTSDVIISRGELMQLLINLLQNAVHAVKGDEAIEIRLAETLTHVSINVKDRGCGIPEEIQNRIFDPFYTTKSNGEGTGLGLSVVYGIIQKYKGSVQVLSTVGKGTSFGLFIPKYSGENE